MHRLLESAMDQTELEMVAAYLDAYSASKENTSGEKKKWIDYTYNYNFDMYENICN